jgi:hypothetical protein
MPTFHRPRRQAESLRVPLHLTLNTYHRPSPFQPTDAQALLYVSSEHLILQARDRVLERLALVLKPMVAVNFCYQGSVANLTECLIHMVMSHVVSMEKPKDVGCDEGRGNVHVVYGGCVDFAVISGAVKGQPPFYERIGCVEMGPDVTCGYFSAVLLDMEGDVSGATVMLKARRCRRCGLSSWLTALHLL